MIFRKEFLEILQFLNSKRTLQGLLSLQLLHSVFLLHRQKALRFQTHRELDQACFETFQQLVTIMQNKFFIIKQIQKIF
jgi:hypothetical protein